jgi:glycosyltransferase involved in cell wall biosynthesis
MSDNKYKTVTVAIPTFNRLEMLKRSVTSVMQQSYEHLEIVISDNASVDGTREYLRTLKDSRVKVFLNNQNLGMAANWENCLLHASGDYFLLMSDDDALANNDALEKLVNGFENYATPDVGIVFSAVQLERMNKESLQRTHCDGSLKKAEELIADFYNNKVSVFPCATLIRTNDIRELGGYLSFDATLAVDACVWISLAIRYGYARYIDEPLAIYRIHESLSSSSLDIVFDDIQAVRQLIDEQHNKLSDVGYQRIIRAIISSKRRGPIGYIMKKWRHDSEYGIKMALMDVYRHRRLLFTYSNLRFAINMIKSK